MTDFDPGKGWREARNNEFAQLTEWINLPNGDKTTRRWVREEPAPGIPTEPYAVIRGRLHGFLHGFVRTPSGLWRRTEDGAPFALSELEAHLRDWEIVARPVDHDAFGNGYKACATALLARLRSRLNINGPTAHLLAELEYEFTA